MYLSRLDLQLSSPAVRQALRNCQDMHRTLMKAFDCTREETDLLYRVIKTEQSIYMYAQCTTLPHWERIEKSGFICTKIQDISALQQHFTENTMFRFSLLAYPSKKVKGNGKNSRRMILHGKEERMDWLKRQGDKYGYVLIEAYESAGEQMQMGKKNSGDFYLSGVPFEGILKINNPEAFQNGFQHGIGPEKAYGLGLLMIGRI